MNYVEPIRSKQKVKDIQEYLKRTNKRNYIMFITGIFTGLRISDILLFKIKDVKNKNVITLREKKTRKQRIIEINKFLKNEYKWYCENKPDDEYLIKSRETANKPITRDMAYKIIKDIGKRFNLDNLGTHTLRKTFGYHYYQQTKNIVVLQELFNHSSPSVTLRYIGIRQDNLNEALRNFFI